MTHRTRGRRLAACLVLAAMIAAAPAAGAQTSDPQPPPEKAYQEREPRPTKETWDMSAAKERAQQAIAHRIAAIDATIDRLRTAELVTDAHKQRLITDLEAVKASLRSLSAEIEAEDDPAALKRLMQRIVTDHYVFAFQLPRARLVAGSDVVVGVSMKLVALADRLEVRVLEAEEQGHDMSTARRHLQALRDKARTAGAIGARTGPMVLDLSVDEYPDNKPVLERAREALRMARTNLTEAHGHGQAVVAELRRAEQG